MFARVPFWRKAGRGRWLRNSVAVETGSKGGPEEVPKGQFRRAVNVRGDGVAGYSVDKERASTLKGLGARL
jgi:hypothetical protein